MTNSGITLTDRSIFHVHSTEMAMKNWMIYYATFLGIGLVVPQMTPGRPDTTQIDHHGNEDTGRRNIEHALTKCKNSCLM